MQSSSPPAESAIPRITRCLHGHLLEDPAAVLARLASWCEETGFDLDMYGKGESLAAFEGKIAALLGYPAGVFLPSGTMAQQIALRVWSERAGSSEVGMHPSSHLELHEQRGYAHLHGLRATLVGPRERPLLAEHLAAVPQALSALLVELPIREAGGQLPSWEQLEELKALCRERRIRLHLDGARLWETRASYQRELAEICGGFDSTYVSFYKGIGALAGAMLLGPEDFVAEARVWQRRHGGNLVTLLPFAASAAMHFDQRLERMRAWLERARSLARVFACFDGVRVLPEEPQVNMMHVFLPFPAEALNAASQRLAQERGLQLFKRAREADLPGVCRTELYVGEAAMEWTDAEVQQALGSLMSWAAR